MRVTLKKIEPLNNSIKTFWMEPAKPFQYTAGQYIEMSLPHPKPDERGTKHWFTLSSSPTEPLVSITTKFSVPSSTFKKTLGSLRVGDSIEISEPMGDFVLPIDASIPLVFIAGGIGVTPFRSITKWLLDTGEKRNIQVLLATSQEGDVVFEDLFRRAGFEPTLIISKPSPDWQGESGHLTAEKILRIIKNSEGKQIYLSGPEPMVEALFDDLQKAGLPKEQLVGDYFPGYTPI